MATYEGERKLLKALEVDYDPRIVSHALEAEGLISISLLSEILSLDTDKERAQKLGDHILNEAKRHHDWYCKLLVFLSGNQWLCEIAELLKDEHSKLICPVMYNILVHMQTGGL